MPRCLSPTLYPPPRCGLAPWRATSGGQENLTPTFRRHCWHGGILDDGVIVGAWIPYWRHYRCTPYRTVLRTLANSGNHHAIPGAALLYQAPRGGAQDILHQDAAGGARGLRRLDRA